MGRNTDLWTAMLMAVLVITGTGIRIGHTQTSLQVVEDQVAELERKLADAKVRQEKAQSVQKQLEEQEQKLIGLEQYLSESDKHRVQVIEIRMGIKSIYAKVEAIIKEKNDLEENLRLAKSLQTTLRDAQTTMNPDIKTPTSPVQAKTFNRRPVINQSPIQTERTSDKSIRWQIGNIHIDDSLNHEERVGIMDFFTSGRYLNQDDILDSAYRIYTTTGAILHFVVHNKYRDIVDLDILLYQRESRNSNYSPNSSLAFMTSAKTLDKFKNDDFRITVKND